MSGAKLFMTGYFIGAVVFACALVIILLRAIGQTQLNPTVPLIGGFILMFGSKFALMASRRKA